MADFDSEPESDDDNPPDDPDDGHDQPVWEFSPDNSDSDSDDEDDLGDRGRYEQPSRFPQGHSQNSAASGYGLAPGVRIAPDVSW